MIQPNELRIGNIVEKGGIEYVADFITIQSAHNYNPIPLTPEILEGCGLSELKTFLIDCWLKYEENENGENELHLICDFVRVTLKPIDHVHQLQNLYFALTGEELTINFP